MPTQEDFDLMKRAAGRWERKAQDRAVALTNIAQAAHVADDPNPHEIAEAVVSYINELEQQVAALQVAGGAAFRSAAKQRGFTEELLGPAQRLISAAGTAVVAQRLLDPKILVLLDQRLALACREAAKAVGGPSAAALESLATVLERG